MAKEKHREHLKTIADGDVLTPTEESPLLGVLASREYETSPSANSENETATAPKLSDAFIRPIMLAVMCNGFLAFIDMCHFSLLPLMWSTSIPLGGLGLDPLRIGATLGTFGFLNAAIQINCMGPLLRRFGVVRVFRFSVRSLLLCFAMYPFMSYFARDSGRVDARVVLCMCVQLCCQTMIYFAYGECSILAPTPTYPPCSLICFLCSRCHPGNRRRECPPRRSDGHC